MGYMTNLHIVDVEYHMELKDGFHRVKVSVLDLGMHFNGFRAAPPNEKHDNWWIFPPQIPIRGRKPVNAVEFNKSEPLWKEISDKCIDCVQEYLRSGKLDKQRVMSKERSNEEEESLYESFDLSVLENPQEDNNEYLSRQ